MLDAIEIETMNNCHAHKSVTMEVKEFLRNVDNVGEESITDFLLWKWRCIDKQFKSINVESFTRYEESKFTGADFEMEGWLVGRSKSYPLVFQAKKFIKPYDGYVNKLNYPKNTKGQMNTLLNYANSKGKIPFYAFYSLPDIKTKAMCRHNDIEDCGVYMSHAKVIEGIADGKYGRRVSKNEILAKSNPFHCIFCCPIAFRGYFEKYFPFTNDNSFKQELPEYVGYLLNTDPLEVDEEKIGYLIKEYELGKFRHVAVYDMRKTELFPNG